MLDAHDAAPPISVSDLASARAFNRYTVYWAGRTVDGVPLTAADNLYDFNTSSGFAMYYGDCESRGTFHASGCTLPVKITTLPTSPTPVSLGPHRLVRLRGVPAAIYGGGDEIEIYTDRQAITSPPIRRGGRSRPRRRRGPSAALRTPDCPAFPQPYYSRDLGRAARSPAASGPPAPPGRPPTSRRRPRSNPRRDRGRSRIAPHADGPPPRPPSYPALQTGCHSYRGPGIPRPGPPSPRRTPRGAVGLDERAAKDPRSRR